MLLFISIFSSIPPRFLFIRRLTGLVGRKEKEASIGSSKLILTFAQTAAGRNVLLILYFSLKTEN